METVNEIFAYKTEEEDEDVIISGLYDQLFVKKVLKLYVSSGIVSRLIPGYEDKGIPVRISPQVFGCYDELFEVFRKGLNKMKTDNKANVNFEYALKGTNEQLLFEIRGKEMTVCFFSEL